MLTRRGFLGTLIAGLASAAVFDPKSLLWVPKPAEALVAPTGGLSIDGVTVMTATEVDRIVEVQLELNDLALRFAKTMGERLERSRAVALHEIIYRHTGNVTLPAGVLDISAHGVGRFESAPRTMKVGDLRTTNMDWLAGEMAMDVGSAQMFAPIGPELRPGEPFASVAYPWGGSGPTPVGIATDPQTGLSARAIRFWPDGRGGKRVEMTGFELAAGLWRAYEPPRETRAVCPRCDVDLREQKDTWGRSTWWVCERCDEVFVESEIRRV